MTVLYLHFSIRLHSIMLNWWKHGDHFYIYTLFITEFCPRLQTKRCFMSVFLAFKDEGTQMVNRPLNTSLVAVILFSFQFQTTISQNNSLLSSILCLTTSTNRDKSLGSCPSTLYAKHPMTTIYTVTHISITYRLISALMSREWSWLLTSNQCQS
jgi:hypothetical protein